MPIQVFISYAWKDHDRNKIGELVRWLDGRDGIKVTSDFDFPDNSYPEVGFPVWMEENIKNADIVLCICGKNYKNAFEKKGGGKGSTCEGAIITNDLYKKFRRNNKYSIILPEANAHDVIPGALDDWVTNLLLTDRKGILSHIKTQYSRQQTNKTQAQSNSQTPKPDTGGPVFRDPQRTSNKNMPRSTTLLHLRFADPTIEYVKQAEVWQAFEGFYTLQNPFSWWLITGDAGTGKSRTALEFCKFLRKMHWCAEFVSLEKTPSEVWSTWSPKQDTLLVIDYVAREFSTNPRDIANIFTTLTLRAENDELGGKRLRILLLEREYKERNETEREFEWYQQLDKQMRYHKEEPFDLSTISDEGLYQIAEQTARSIWKYPGPFPAAQDFLGKLEELDDKKRPLFAMLLAGYLTKDNLITKIAPNEVLDFAIEQEFERFLIPAGIGEDPSLFHALLLSTCTSGKLCACQLPDDHRLWNSGLGEEIDENNFLFYPIEPDLLGERFVLNCDNRRNQLHINKEKLKELLRISWREAPVETGNFFVRCVQDFASSVPDSEKITDFFLSSMPTAIEENSLRQKAICAYAAYTIVSLTAYFGKAGNIEEARKLFDGMIAFDYTPEIRLARAQVAFNLVTLYGNAKNLEEARKLFNDMDTFSFTPATKLECAKAAVNLISFYCNAGKIKKAKKLFYEMPFGNTPEFNLLKAKATLNLITGYAQAKNVTEARKYFHYMMVTFGGTPEFRPLRAKAAFNLTKGYLNAGQIDNAKSLLNELKNNKALFSAYLELLSGEQEEAE